MTAKQKKELKANLKKLAAKLLRNLLSPDARHHLGEARKGEEDPDHAAVVEEFLSDLEK